MYNPHPQAAELPGETPQPATNPFRRPTMSQHASSSNGTSPASVAGGHTASPSLDPLGTHYSRYQRETPLYDMSNIRPGGFPSTNPFGQNYTQPYTANLNIPVSSHMEWMRGIPFSSDNGRIISMEYLNLMILQPRVTAGCLPNSKVLKPISRPY